MITRQCVVLIGGLGSRLGELTRTVPKPLLPVDGVPFLQTLLREAARRGFNDIVLLAGHGAKVVTDYLTQSDIARKLGVGIRVNVEPRPMGTAGALIFAAPLLANEFVLLNGDTWFDFNWLDLAARATSAGRMAAMALRVVDNPDRYETVEIDGAQVVAFRGRQPGLKSGQINGGVYWLRKDALREGEAPSSLETDLMPRICAAGQLAAWTYEGFFIDIGIPETFAAAQWSVPAQCRRPAAFLDRDGVLNQDNNYVHRREDFIWIEGAKAAVKKLNDCGYYVFVVTNQAGIARGLYTEDDLRQLHAWICSELRENGAAIDDWRFCPFHPEATVTRYRMAHEWRKPAPGMIDDLLSHWPVDRSRSFIIGDKETDMQAARAASLRGYLYRSGNLSETVDDILAGRSD